MLLVVCTGVDFSVGQETRKGRVSGCDDSKHNLEDVIWAMMNRVGIVGVEQKISHMEQILETLLNITTAQERRKNEHRQDIENMREPNRGVITNMTEALERRESQHRQDIEEMREQNRGLIANMTTVLERKETEHRREMEELKKHFRELQSNVTQEIKRRESEQDERFRNISATSEKDVQSLKSNGSAGIKKIY